MENADQPWDFLPSGSPGPVVGMEPLRAVGRLTSFTETGSRGGVPLVVGTPCPPFLASKP